MILGSNSKSKDHIPSKYQQPTAKTKIPNFGETKLNRITYLSISSYG